MVKSLSVPRTGSSTALDRLVFKDGFINRKFLGNEHQRVFIRDDPIGNAAVNIELTQRLALCYSMIRNDMDLYQLDKSHPVP